MLAEGYLRRRYEAGLKAGEERGKAEGKAAGLKEGEERGVAQAWEVWQDWNLRRMDAEKADHPFNETTSLPKQPHLTPQTLPTST